MSELALDLLELRRVTTGRSDALLERRLREVAARLISAGLRDFRAGC